MAIESDKPTEIKAREAETADHIMFADLKIRASLEKEGNDIKLAVNENGTPKGQVAIKTYNFNKNSRRIDTNSKETTIMPLDWAMENDPEFAVLISQLQTRYSIVKDLWVAEKNKEDKQP